MTVQAIIDRAMRLWYVDISQYPAANAIEDLNVIYHDFENDIVTKIREDFFWDYFITDTVVNQVEYILPWAIWDWWTSLEKWDWVSVKYTTDWDFIKAKRIDQNWLEFDDSYYAKNQSVLDPFYYIKDNSVFLFPAPTNSAAWWVKMEWIKWLSDLEVAWTEEDVFNNLIPTKFHSVIAQWMLEFIYQSRWMITEANNAWIIYANKKTIMINQLQDRDYMPVPIEDPDLTNLS